MKRAIILTVLLLAGCEKGKKEVDEATKSCQQLGGRAVYFWSNSNTPAIYRIECRVKTPDGSHEYTVQPDGSAP